MLTPSAPRRQRLAAHARKLVAVAKGSRCSLCGCRYHHHPIWNLGIRACDLCLKENTISGTALYADFGIDFTRHAAVLAFHVFYFVVEHGRQQDGRVQAHFSNRAVDFAHRTIPHVFFWRPHLEAVFDLAEAEARQRVARTKAAPRLTAAVRALYARLTIAHQGHPVKPISSHVFFTSQSSEWAQGQHAAHLPLSPVSSTTEAIAAARALLQRLFLAYDGRLVVTRTRCPRRTLDMLRQHEATRCHRRVPWYSPSIYCIKGGDHGALFRDRVQTPRAP